jgi:heme-degrading monooxygenase HmoA
MITRIWHGRTTAAKSDEYLNLMRTVAIPDYRSTPGNKGAYALRRIEGDTAHFLMLTFWESEDAVRAFAGEDISVANTTISIKASCSKWNRLQRITKRMVASESSANRVSGVVFGPA